MKPGQQRIAIAEACGWRLVENNPEYEPYWEDPKGNMIGVNCGLRFPDYLNDLNAMHEAEKVLTAYQQKVSYSDNLMKIVGYGSFDAASATAAQRAKAFLRTLGKWVES